MAEIQLFEQLKAVHRRKWQVPNQVMREATILDILPMAMETEMKLDHAYFMPGLSNAFDVVDQCLAHV